MDFYKANKEGKWSEFMLKQQYSVCENCEHLGECDAYYHADEEAIITDCRFYEEEEDGT